MRRRSVASGGSESVAPTHVRPSLCVENRAMTATPTATRFVYDFAEGSRDLRVLLGGKGANIAEMTRVLGAELVPAGFTITTEACVAFMHGDDGGPEGLDEAVDEALARLE